MGLDPRFVRNSVGRLEYAHIVRKENVDDIEAREYICAIAWRQPLGHCLSRPRRKTAAEAALLTLSDYPPGWTSQPAGEVDFGPFELSEECKILDADTLPGESYSTASDDFTGPQGNQASTLVSVFTSDLAALIAFNMPFRTLCRIAGKSCRGH